MATVNLGSIKFNWKGAYNNATAYVADDVMSTAGASYICILASTGNTAPNATYWEMMSIAGVDGTDLGTVITTQGDVAYRDASGLQRLAAGTSGQVLKTQGASANPVWADGGGGMTSLQVFTTSGTWTKPAGVKSVRVQLVGSGAGGRNSNIEGGAGGYSEKFIDVTAITSETVTVGPAPGSSTAGNTSSFGTHCSATGGQNPSGSGGGIGGTGSGGDINIMGGGGRNAYSSTSGSNKGASSYFGGGNAGPGTGPGSPINVANGAYGGGGGNTANGYSGTPSPKSGIVIVYEYK